MYALYSTSNSAELTPRSTRISRWRHLLPIRLVLQLHFRCFFTEERLCASSAPDGLSPDGRFFSHVSQLTCTYRCQLKFRLLDTVVLDKIPNPEYLALANSLAFSVAVGAPSARLTTANIQAVGRAIGPFIVSYFFSISTHAASPYSFGRHMVWVLFIGICIPSLVLAAKLDQDSQGEKDDSEEEQHELLSHY